MTPLRPTSSLRSLLALLALSPLVACGGTSTSQLVTSDVVEPGETCASGGVELTFGEDADGDGALTGDEISDSQVLCSGDSSAVFGSLVTTSQIAPGEECPSGGLQIDGGLDNGDGGGVAGDGVLQDGEIDTTDSVCFPGTSTSVEETTSPAGPAGTFTINVGGGDASECGGDGGEMSFASNNNGMNGSVRLFATGVVDASFTMPTAVARFGAFPWVVSSDASPARLPDADCNGIPDASEGLSVGDVYMVDCPNSSTNEERLWQWNGTSGDRVTGVDVAAGATLTLPPAGTGAKLRINDDVRNAGTITLGGVSNELVFDAENYVGLAGSMVQTSGVSDGDGADIIFDLDSSFVNAGDIVANGDAAGSGGNIYIEVDSSMFNAGRWSTQGGDSTDDSWGGDGGDIEVDVDAGNGFNRGVISTTGGDGGDGGGDGGSFEWYARQGLRNLGAISTSGGAAGATCSGSCEGGDAGDMELYTEYGDVRNNAALTAMGGDGGRGGNGGEGGDFYFGAGGSGSVWVSGDLIGSGGTGTNGGRGGSLEAEVFEQFGQRSHVSFLGYATVQSSGGDAPSAGNCDGGEGGEFMARAGCSTVANGGSVVIGADVIVDGGVGYDGGQGGFVFAEACYDKGRSVGQVMAGEVVIGGGSAAFNVPDSGRDVLISGKLSARGGEGLADDGDNGGTVSVLALHNVRVEQSVVSSGGNGADGTGWGGEGYFEAILGNVELAGYEGVGGTSSGDGSEGGFGGDVVASAGGIVTVSGPLTLKGGECPSGEGGEGGNVAITSASGPTVSAGIDVSGGAGQTPGGPGRTYIDGVPR